MFSEGPAAWFELIGLKCLVATARPILAHGSLKIKSFASHCGLPYSQPAGVHLQASCVGLVTRNVGSLLHRYPQRCSDAINWWTPLNDCFRL
jgi:hypothetical protein